MYHSPDVKLWTGRVDDEEAIASLRWHQVIQPCDDTMNQGAVLIGFASDEGVKRNKGRTGAAAGPDAIRSALANLACIEGVPCYDDGTVSVDGDDLEAAQLQLGDQIARRMNQGLFPVILGGGHEIAFGSYQGIEQWMDAHHPGAKLGIINFDAHLDLRTPSPLPSSGTPFRQIAERRLARNENFDYCVIGYNPTANTAGLVHFADQHNVVRIEDSDCSEQNRAVIEQKISKFIAAQDFIYVTICLDVFPAAFAPGVSAPAALGVMPTYAFGLLKHIRQQCRTHNSPLVLADIAEMNPAFDRDGITAKLAGRLVSELAKQ